MDKLRLEGNKLYLEYDDPICPKCKEPVPVWNAKVKGKVIEHRVCHA